MSKTATCMHLKVAALLAFAVYATAAFAAKVEQVIVRQQWPWTTDIRVEYKLTGVTGLVDVAVAAYDGDRQIPQTDLDAATTGDRFAVSSSGVHSFVIDPIKALGTSQIDLRNFRVCLSVADSPESMTA